MPPILKTLVVSLIPHLCWAAAPTIVQENILKYQKAAKTVEEYTVDRQMWNCEYTEGKEFDIAKVNPVDSARKTKESAYGTVSKIVQKGSKGLVPSNYKAVLTSALVGQVTNSFPPPGGSGLFQEVQTVHEYNKQLFEQFSQLAPYMVQYSSADLDVKTGSSEFSCSKDLNAMKLSLAERGKKLSHLSLKYDYVLKRLENMNKHYKERVMSKTFLAFGVCADTPKLMPGTANALDDEIEATTALRDYSKQKAAELEAHQNTLSGVQARCGTAN